MATIASAADGNYSEGASWTGGVVPGLNDIATVKHIITLDVNANLGGIDPAGTGCLVGSNPAFRLLVGISGRPQFMVRAICL